MHVPYGCLLKLGQPQWGNWEVTPVAGIGPWQAPVSPRADWQGIAEQFLNTAYLWGGKSVFGIDAPDLPNPCIKSSAFPC